MAPLRRLQDALRVLLGRSEPQVEVARIRAQWASIAMEIASVMEQLTAMEGRLAARERRARKRAEAPSPAHDQPPLRAVPAAGWDRKAEIMRRARQGQLAAPTSGNALLAPAEPDGEDETP